MASNRAAIVGTWLGPEIGDAGRCGAAYGEWFFAADGSYQDVNRSNDCGGVTVWGTYEMTASEIVLHQQRTDCPACVQKQNFRVGYRFVSSVALEIVDGTITLTYVRQ